MAKALSTAGRETPRGGLRGEKSQSRTKPLPPGAGDISAPESLGDQYFISSRCQNLIRKALHSIFREMNIVDVQALAFRYLDGWSLAQVAALWGISVGQTSRRLRRVAEQVFTGLNRRTEIEDCLRNQSSDNQSSFHQAVLAPSFGEAFISALDDRRGEGDE